MLSLIWHNNVAHSLLCASLSPGLERDCLPVKAVAKLKLIETEEITGKQRGNEKECTSQAVLMTLFNLQKRKKRGTIKHFLSSSSEFIVVLLVSKVHDMKIVSFFSDVVSP